MQGLSEGISNLDPEAEMDTYVLEQVVRGRNLYETVWYVLQALCLINVVVCTSLVATSYVRLRRLRRRLTGWCLDDAVSGSDGAWRDQVGRQRDAAELMRSIRICLVRVSTGAFDLAMCCILGIQFLFLRPHPEGQSPRDLLPDPSVVCLEMGGRQISQLEIFICSVGLLMAIRIGISYGDELIVWRRPWGTAPSPTKHQVLSVRGQFYISLGVFTTTMILFSCKVSASGMHICLDALDRLPPLLTLWGPISLVFVVSGLALVISIGLIRSWSSAQVFNLTLPPLKPSRAHASRHVTVAMVADDDDAPGPPSKGSGAPSCLALKPPKVSWWHSIALIWMTVVSIWLPWTLNMGTISALFERPGVLHWTLVLLHMESGCAVFLVNLLNLTIISSKRQ